MAKKKDANLGNYFYRGGHKFHVERLPDRFTARLKHKTDPDHLARAYNCQFDQEIPRQRLAEFSVDAATRDEVMDRVRQGNEVEFASHVYQIKNDPASKIYLTDEITVQFKSDVPEETIEEIARTHGLQLIKEVSGLPQTYVFRVTADARENPIKIANRLMDDDRVEAAEPNVMVQSHSYYTPSDTLYPQQWHLHHNGGLFLSANSHIDAARAWDITRGTRSVVVAVADDSVDLSHTDFQGAGKIVAPRDFAGRDFDPAPELPADNHGTACAGVAVAEENGLGVVGVAPECALMPIRTSGFLDDNSIEELFEWVTVKGASVVSCSWGASAINFPLSLRQKQAIHRAATEGRNGKGCVIVFAAGNANRPVNGEVNEKGWPNNLLSGPTQWLAGFAAHEDVIAVSACTSLGKKAAYSNWGKEISVCAPSNNAHPGFFFAGIGMMRTYPLINSDFPGRGIVTTDRVGPSGYTAMDYTYNFGGTSSACPTVAGVAALVLSVNPDLTAKEVREILETTADKIEDPDTDPQLGHAFGTYDEQGHSQWFGYGKVNAFKAVIEALRRKGGMQEKTIKKSSEPNVEIPDNDFDGIADTIEIGESGVIAEAKVGVEIKHSYIGDLQVLLQTPDGQVMTLHSRNGGSQNDLKKTFHIKDVPDLSRLIGEDIQGAWTLLVRDHAPGDSGVLKKWFLEFTLQERQITEFFISPGTIIPDNDPEGIEETIQVTARGAIKDLEVVVDITHTYVGDLAVALITPAGETIPLHFREGGTRDNLIRPYTPASHPPLQQLIGKPAEGVWRLKVADLARLDKGKLNHWGIRFWLDTSS